MLKSIMEDARNILNKDPAARSLIEVLLLYPSMHAIIWYRMSNFLYRHKFYFMARLFSQIGRANSGIEIHPGATIGRRLFIDHGFGVVIGETATVGDDCVFYHGVTLGGVETIEKKRHPDVGNRVLIGSGAKILGPIRINDDAKIGANAVVLNEVPEGATAVGIPARILVHKKDDSHLNVYYYNYI